MQRKLRWAWALTGALDLGFGVAAATIAITNERSHLIGASIWTVALAALAHSDDCGDATPASGIRRGTDLARWPSARIHEECAGADREPPRPVELALRPFNRPNCGLSW
jgi:hypothetical protein